MVKRPPSNTDRLSAAIADATAWFLDADHADLSIDTAITAIRRVHYSAWSQFSPHHFLQGGLPRNSQLYVAYCHSVALAAASLQPTHATPPRYRVSRWCTLPPYRHHRIGTQLLTIIARAALLAPIDLRLLTSSLPTVRHLLATRQWVTSSTRRHHAPGSTAHHTQRHSRLPDGTRLYELVPSLLALLCQTTDSPHESPVSGRAKTP